MGDRQTEDRQRMQERRERQREVRSWGRVFYPPPLAAGTGDDIT